MRFKNTNGPGWATFQDALLNGSAPNGGLWNMDKDLIPRFSIDDFRAMWGKNYPEVAFRVLKKILCPEMSEATVYELLNLSYDETIISLKLEDAGNSRFILRFEGGPSLAFKDFAMRFLSVFTNHFLRKLGLKRDILGATSGDTGPAMAKAFQGMDQLRCFVLYAKGNPTEEQRRQMTTVGGNIFAIEVEDGNFDLCQAMMKQLLADKQFACDVFGDENHYTTANSINLGRVLAQIVYHFWAYAQLETCQPMVISIGCGNYGNLTSATIAYFMGLPLDFIVAAQNGNDVFHRFYKTGKYEVNSLVRAPSHAMEVADPNNMPRLIDLFGGHMDSKHRILTQPDMWLIRRIFRTATVDPRTTFAAMREARGMCDTFICPHGGVAWAGMNSFTPWARGPQVVYNTAAPAKFPREVKEATGEVPPVPEVFLKEATMPERIFKVKAPAIRNDLEEIVEPSEPQMRELREILYQLREFRG